MQSYHYSYDLLTENYTGSRNYDEKYPFNSRSKHKRKSREKDEEYQKILKQNYVMKFIMITFLGSKGVTGKTTQSFNKFSLESFERIWDKLTLSLMSFSNSRKSLLGRKIFDLIVELESTPIENSQGDFSGNSEWLNKSIAINATLDLNIKY